MEYGLAVMSGENPLIKYGNMELEIKDGCERWEMIHLEPSHSCGLWANSSTSIWADRKYLGLYPVLHGPKGSFQEHGLATLKQNSVLE